MQGQPPSATSFSRAELRKLLAPIALYPDPLLAQLLPASAYALQIVLAQRWLDKNPAAVENNDFSWIDRQNRDPAVKALARFPDHCLCRGPHLRHRGRRRRVVDIRLLELVELGNRRDLRLRRLG